jgi:hypothetical protein
MNFRSTGGHAMPQSIRRTLAALLVALGLFASFPVLATAGAPLFQTEAQAKQHCPADTVVWINTATGVFHFKGQRWYGRTKSGAFACMKEAPGRATKNGQ